MPVTVVSWNIGKRQEPWRQLVGMDADVALLQEATSPPPDVARGVDTGPPEHWDSHIWNSRWYEGRLEGLYDRWPIVVKLSDRVEVQWFKQVSPISETRQDEVAVSGIGTIAAARVIPRDIDAAPFIAVSMYARWIKPHPSTQSKWRVGYPDGSAHRVISDLSTFIGSTDPGTHRILAAGDLNTIYGATDDNRLALPGRDRTITDRMDALGLEFLGPRYPAGRAGQPCAAGPASRQPEHTDVLHNAPVPRDGSEPTRLRLRLSRLPPERQSARDELRRRLGRQRPLSPADRSRRLVVSTRAMHSWLVRAR